jgi:hypothetical protein
VPDISGDVSILQNVSRSRELAAGLQLGPQHGQPTSLRLAAQERWNFQLILIAMVMHRTLATVLV